MADKAEENLAAARLLADTHEHDNAAASRAYYAAYQACWFGMISEGYPVTHSEHGDYFLHKMLPQQACEAGVLDEEQSEALEFLEGLRVTADYHSDHVTNGQARRACDTASRLLDHVLGEERRDG